MGGLCSYGVLKPPDVWCPAGLQAVALQVCVQPFAVLGALG